MRTVRSSRTATSGPGLEGTVRAGNLWGVQAAPLNVHQVRKWTGQKVRSEHNPHVMFNTVAHLLPPELKRSNPNDLLVTRVDSKMPLNNFLGAQVMGTLKKRLVP